MGITVPKRSASFRKLAERVVRRRLHRLHSYHWGFNGILLGFNGGSWNGGTPIAGGFISWKIPSMDDLEIPPWQETPKSTHNGIEDDKIMQYLCVGMVCYGMDRVWLPKTSIRINSEKRLVVLQPYLAEIKQGWNSPKPTGPLGPWAPGHSHGNGSKFRPGDHRV
jgi:hypothetical protein